MGEELYRGIVLWIVHWNGGKLEKGKDDVIRSVKPRTSKSHIEQSIQHLYPLEFHCDMEKSTSKSKNTNHKKLNGDVKEHSPWRTGATIAGMRIKDIVAEQLDEWLNHARCGYLILDIK